MKVLGVIPARFGSTRFPGKPLAMIGDKTMVHRTYLQASKSSLDGVVVATDDTRILDEVRRFGGEAVMTRADHRSGTDRCREALDKVGNGFGAVVNIQGDEPFIDPALIDQLVCLIKRDDTELATLVKPIQDEKELLNPNVVKVVFDALGNALYFSRSPIPFVRDTMSSHWLQKTAFYHHLGVYAYKAETLRRIASLAPGKLEQAESLEQLRWLENGMRIRVAVTEYNNSISIDTPQDLANLPNDLLL